FTAPTFTDLCKGPITPNSMLTTNVIGCTNVITRTWTAQDGCGNTNTASQTVTVIDITPPAVATPQGGNHTTNCPSAPSFTAPTFNDTCKGAITPTAVTTTNAIGCTNVITRTWTAQDGCGNSNSVSQVVTVIDITPPSVTCSTNKSVECGTAFTFDPPTGTDSCSGTNVTIAIVNTVTNPLCGLTFSATRTWSVKDPCGNSNGCVQTVTVIDTTPPTITCASNKTVECNGAINFDPPTATDCLGLAITNITVVTNDFVTTNGLGQVVHTRTWKATDGCTNSSLCSQSIA